MHIHLIIIYAISYIFFLIALISHYLLSLFALVPTTAIGQSFSFRKYIFDILSLRNRRISLID